MKGKTVRILIGVFIFTLIAGVAGAQILPQAQTQTLLPALSIPQFVEPLPVAGDIAVVDATGGGTHDIGVFEFKAQVLPRPANWPAGAPAGCTAGTWSWTWGYRSAADYDGPAIPDYRPLNAGAVRESYLGPVVVALRGTPASFNYFNFLPDTAQQPMGVTDPSHVLANLPIDLTLDWALKTVVDCAPDPLTGDYTNGDCANWPPWGYSSPFMNEQVPIATHLHGGEVPPAFDGGPDAWITQNGMTGTGYPGLQYDYDNDQQESTIWFHDHGLGVTRLNVYAGLAGIYPIMDPANPPQATMPAFPQYDIPLIIQDRTFDDTCQIFYNLASNPQPNPTVHPFWIPEFIGDTIVVNGKTWPYLNVEERQYRFRFVNGSNARFYDLSLDKGLQFVVIATDDGYLANAVQTPNLIIAPGERYEVIVDFSKVKKKKNPRPGFVDTVTMFNAAPTPFPAGVPPVLGLTDRVMQFKLSLGAPASDIPPIVNGTAIRNATTPIINIAASHVPTTGSITRQLTLNEVIGPGGPLELVVNNSKFNWTTSIPGQNTVLGRETELPAVGDTEIWEIINITADAHPMHTHLTSFQVIDRTPFRSASWIAQYDTLMKANGVLPGDGPPYPYNELNADGAIGGNPPISAFLDIRNRRLPLPYEMGWKDVVVTYPGEVTRIAVRWATTDTPLPADPAAFVGTNTYPFEPTSLQGPNVGYVWHCHIIDHEDNEMMRNYTVGTARQGVVDLLP